MWLSCLDKTLTCTLWIAYISIIGCVFFPVSTKMRTDNKRKEWYYNRLWWRTSCRCFALLKVVQQTVCKDFEWFEMVWRSLKRSTRFQGVLKKMTGGSERVVHWLICIFAKCAYCTVCASVTGHALCNIAFRPHSAIRQTLTLSGFRRSEW